MMFHEPLLHIVARKCEPINNSIYLSLFQKITHHSSKASYVFKGRLENHILFCCLRIQNPEFVMVVSRGASFIAGWRY